MFDHWNYFLNVVVQTDIFIDYKRTRQQLTRFQIKHINLKRRTLRYKLITHKEHQAQLKLKHNSRHDSIRVIENQDNLQVKKPI